MQAPRKVPAFSSPDATSPRLTGEKILMKKATRLVLRRPNESDFPALLLLTRNIAEEFKITRLILHYNQLSSEEFARAFRTEPSWSAVLQVGEQIAGYVLICPKAEEPLKGELSKLYVKAEFRHQGLGYLLINSAIAAAQDLGFPSLYIDTAREFEVVKFYEFCGAKKVTDHRYPDVPNSWAMELAIPEHLVFIRKPPGTRHRAPQNVNLGCGWEPAPDKVNLQSLANAARELLNTTGGELPRKTIERAKRAKCWFYWQFAEAWVRYETLLSCGDASVGDGYISVALYLFGDETRNGRTFAEAKAEAFRLVLAQRFGPILDDTSGASAAP